MELIGDFFIIAFLAALIYGIWQWRKAAKAGADPRQAQIITTVAGILLFVSGGLAGGVNIIALIGTMIVLAGGAGLIYGIRQLLKARRRSMSLRQPMIITIIAAAVFLIGGAITSAAPESAEQAARTTLSEKSSKQSQSKRKVKSNASTKKAAEQQSREAEEEEEAASRSAVEASSEAKASEEAAAKSEKEAAESSSKAAAESSAAASSSIAQAAAESTSRVAAESSSRVAAAAASSSQASAVAAQNAAQDNTQQTIYITSTGNRYHFDRNCRGLRKANSITSTSSRQRRIWVLRNVNLNNALALVLDIILTSSSFLYGQLFEQVIVMSFRCII
ncbi:hypothetical protein J5F27_10045 [Schleiferilactobacillus harbinensis]|uniref:hypothetical protein n=1 Tax=Schleiferilactobacillus harbinensis TaxID=304207 RepID=UPI001AAEF6E3|nr:hypothetical protein [Schleiferilactobacillus harbinensis]MBO3092261.1 hypothetical protein [Schleiferilactobacillus harbinensis]